MLMPPRASPRIVSLPSLPCSVSRPAPPRMKSLPRPPNTVLAPSPAAHRVVGLIGEDQVGVDAGRDAVAALAADHRVGAVRAVDRVGAAVAEDEVGPVCRRSASRCRRPESLPPTMVAAVAPNRIDRVVAFVAEEHHVAAVADCAHRVVAETAEEVSLAADDPHTCRCPGCRTPGRCRAGSCGDHVVAEAANHVSLPRTPSKRIVAAVPEDQVGPGAARWCRPRRSNRCRRRRLRAARPPCDDIGAVAAEHLHRAGGCRPEDAVVLGAAVHRAGVAGLQDDRVVAAVAGDGREPVPMEMLVVAGEADDGARAGVAGWFRYHYRRCRWLVSHVVPWWSRECVRDRAELRGKPSCLDSGFPCREPQLYRGSRARGTRSH